MYAFHITINNNIIRLRLQNITFIMQMAMPIRRSRFNIHGFYRRKRIP